jgi:hypothetical protein
MSATPPSLTMARRSPQPEARSESSSSPEPASSSSSDVVPPKETVQTRRSIEGTTNLLDRLDTEEHKGGYRLRVAPRPRATRPLSWPTAPVQASTGAIPKMRIPQQPPPASSPPPRRPVSATPRVRFTGIPSPLSPSPPIAGVLQGPSGRLQRVPFPDIGTPKRSDTLPQESMMDVDRTMWRPINPGPAQQESMMDVDRTRWMNPGSPMDLDRTRLPVPQFGSRQPQGPTFQQLAQQGAAALPTTSRAPTSTSQPIPYVDGRIPWVRIRDLGKPGIPSLLFLKPNKNPPFGYIAYHGPMPRPEDLIRVRPSILPQFLQRRK